MNTNIHDEVRNLLAAYEQGLLLPEDEFRVEEHLYECDECFHAAASFSGAESLLRRSPVVREEISRLAGLPGSAEKKETESPSSSGFLKYLLAAAAVLVVAIPSYIFLSLDETVVPDQKIMLLPLRGNGQAVVDLTQGGMVEISFASDEFANSGTMMVRILSEDGQVFFEDADFDKFNEVGAGAIQIDAGKLRPGRCRLEVSRSGSTSPLRVFYFTVR